MPARESEHVTPPRPQPADVGRALGAAIVTGGSTAELRRIVCDYVRVLKRAEVPPEQALRRVKEVVGVSTLTPLPARETLGSVRLAEEVVEWFVSEYYRVD